MFGREFAGGVPMNELLLSYLPLVVFIGVALAIVLALLAAPFLVAYKRPDSEKLSAYECGFNAFDDARMKFDVRFYLVAILFIIFDLEVSFLFPWAVSIYLPGEQALIPLEMQGTIFAEVLVFLATLAVAYIYAWRKGVFDWR